MRKKKPVMNVFLANQTWVEGGKYNLHWGKKSVNSNTKKFVNYKQAIKAKNELASKYKKKGYKVNYNYAAD